MLMFMVNFLHMIIAAISAILLAKVLKKSQELYMPVILKVLLIVIVVTNSLFCFQALYRIHELSNIFDLTILNIIYFASLLLMSAALVLWLCFTKKAIRNYKGNIFCTYLFRNGLNVLKILILTELVSYPLYFNNVYNIIPFNFRIYVISDLVINITCMFFALLSITLWCFIRMKTNNSTQSRDYQEVINVG